MIGKCKFHEVLKYDVTPICEKDFRKDETNNRPKSILSNLSKAFGKDCLNNQYYLILRKNHGGRYVLKFHKGPY